MGGRQVRAKGEGLFAGCDGALWIALAAQGSGETKIGVSILRRGAEVILVIRNCLIQAALFSERISEAQLHLSIGGFRAEGLTKLADCVHIVPEVHPRHSERGVGWGKEGLALQCKLRLIRSLLGLSHMEPCV